ncbi:hypothetical protein TL16_g13234 [Triparma laevis f. inornata]|uniref:Uncharacterized protein n=3 Tax=Triparma laevis TaxID=1534972 RepID=A0A9W7AI02_9STRA|nr:hypothetical protein TrLO_g13727 [Triparma laevis f. longispina]GMH95799.1 hypothetical protein TL16_g13234 [Triparma laevis f. inornata]
MTIPDSLITLGDDIFLDCSKLVPSSIDIKDKINEDDVTSDDVAQLCSQEQQILDQQSLALINQRLITEFFPFLSRKNVFNMDDFRKYFLLFVSDDALMALRLATKAWKRVVDAFIDEGVESGRMIIHGGKNIIHYEDDRKALEERRALATQHG